MRVEVKKAEFRCKDCGRTFCCPTCRRPYDDGDAVARQIVQKEQIGEANYCNKCKANFSIAVAAALKKLAARKN